MSAGNPRTVEEVWADRGNALGQNITRLMEARRMSFRDLSHATALSTTAIYHLVDVASDPRLSSLYKIADFFGLSLDALYHMGSPGGRFSASTRATRLSREGSHG